MQEDAVSPCRCLDDLYTVNLKPALKTTFTNDGQHDTSILMNREKTYGLQKNTILLHVRAGQPSYKPYAVIEMLAFKIRLLGGSARL